MSENALPPDEREAFEKWAVTQVIPDSGGAALYLLDRRGDGYYHWPATETAWDGWQARARLAVQQEQALGGDAAAKQRPWNARQREACHTVFDTFDWGAICDEARQFTPDGDERWVDAGAGFERGWKAALSTGGGDAVSAAAPPGGWRPIETAPKDGSVIDLRCGGGIERFRAHDARFNGTYWVWDVFGEPRRIDSATHWMPRPLDPEATHG